MNLYLCASSRRKSIGADPFLMDVHGLTLKESIEYTQARLQRWQSNYTHSTMNRYPPLKIITGIGLNSRNYRDPVLLPGLTRELSKDPTLKIESDSAVGQIIIHFKK